MAKKGVRKIYELVPEKKIDALSEDVQALKKNPVLHIESIKNIGVQLETVNDSIVSLLDVLHRINSDVSFDQKEEDRIKKQLRPFTHAIKEIKEQNEIIANGMVNIIDRINDLHALVRSVREDTIPTPRTIPNFSLPPLSGGPVPPDEEGFRPLVQHESSFPSMMQNSPSQEFPPLMPPPLQPQQVQGNAIPPMEPNQLGKKRLF